MREKLLKDARRRAQHEEEEVLVASDGYRGDPGQLCLLYDMRGDALHIKWLGDLSIRIAEGIARFSRPCHGLYLNCMTRLDIRGHAVSKDGVLAIVKALKVNTQLVTLRLEGKGIDFDVSSSDYSIWRLYSTPNEMDIDSSVLNLDENRLAFLSKLNHRKEILALGYLLYARPQLILGENLSPTFGFLYNYVYKTLL